MMAGGGENDFYSVLGLKPDCSDSELRKAYKKLAMRWHPDKWSASGNSKVAEESKNRFQAIQEAYSVLSDGNKRFLYDAGVYEDDDDDGMGDFLGEMVVMMNESKAQARISSPSGPFMSGSESFEDLQDLFTEMFEADLHTPNGIQRASSPLISSSKERNSSDFHMGKLRVEEIGEGSFMDSGAFGLQSFSLGSHQGSTKGNSKGRRKIGRKHSSSLSGSRRVVRHEVSTNFKFKYSR
eukprot:Gb_35968 [translate_table: standard]